MAVEMTSIAELYSIYSRHPEIVTDSRKVIPGSLFFALHGENFNGNDFAGEALNKGAEYAVVDQTASGNQSKLIRVGDTLETLQELARYHRKNIDTTVLAITGSNGKTTTKELCRAVLRKKYAVQATSGNLNNHIGVPLTILKIGKKTGIAIVEMGANHMGEIRGLCDIVLPDCGLITNIGKAHLEGFGTIEGVTKAKGELFDFLMSNNKVIFANFGNDHIKHLLPGNYANLVPYNNDLFYGTELSSDPYLLLELHLGNTRTRINSRLVGRYNLENIVAAAKVGDYFGIASTAIKEAIEQYIPDNNRSQLILSGKNEIVMDAYNANPSSMKSSIADFMQMKGLNKVLILGQMLELGESSESEHMEIVDFIKKLNLQLVVLIGEEFTASASATPFLHFTTVGDAIEYMKIHPVQSAQVLVKGSRGNRLEEIVPYL